MGESNCVITAAVSPMVIVAAPSDYRKTRIVIHADCPVAIPDFEMKAINSVVSCALDEILEQQPADALPLAAGKHRNEQELRFAGDGSDQREADRFFTIS